MMIAILPMLARARLRYRKPLGGFARNAFDTTRSALAHSSTLDVCNAQALQCLGDFDCVATSTFCERQDPGHRNARAL